MSDWRNPSDYDYTKNLSLGQWAWEFLRRSQAYRDLWKELNDFEEKEYEGKKVGDTVMIPLGLYNRGEALGLASLPSPDVPAHQVPDLKWCLGVEMKRVSPDMVPDHPAIVRFAVNLSLPIEPQLQAMANELHALKQEYDDAGHPAIAPPYVRKRTETWATYLRLLDAKLAGANITEMGRVVFAETSNQRGNAQNGLRKAEKFAESEYRQLLFMSDPTVPHTRPETVPVPTTMVRILLGSDWEGRLAGEVVEVDSLRGDWLLANLPGSRLIE
jgi:hypothetical protein